MWEEFGGERVCKAPRCPSLRLKCYFHPSYPTVQDLTKKTWKEMFKDRHLRLTYIILHKMMGHCFLG